MAQPLINLSQIEHGKNKNKSLEDRLSEIESRLNTLERPKSGSRVKDYEKDIRRINKRLEEEKKD